MARTPGTLRRKKIAQVWNDVTSRARQEMNDNGFDIGLRDDWHLPYVDDADFIRNAGRDEWLASLPVAEQAKARLSGRQPPIEFARQAWVDDVYNTQDRSNYVNPDGSPMNDIEYRQALEAIFETKATDGANKIDPGAFMGTGGIKKPRLTEQGDGVQGCTITLRLHGALYAAAGGGSDDVPPAILLS